MGCMGPSANVPLSIGHRVIDITNMHFIHIGPLLKRDHSFNLWAFYHSQWANLEAASHMRLGARDYFTSSTLIGGKGRAGPSSLHTTLEGPTECVNARWMQSLHGFLHGVMFHGLFSKSHM